MEKNTAGSAADRKSKIMKLALNSVIPCFLKAFYLMVKYRCVVHPGARIFFAISSEKHTEIGNNVWLGSNTVVIDGTKIGNYSVISANSFVNSDMPEAVIAAGTPAKVIKER